MADTWADWILHSLLSFQYRSSHMRFHQREQSYVSVWYFVLCHQSYCELSVERNTVLFNCALSVYLYLFATIILSESATSPAPALPRRGWRRVNSWPPKHPAAFVEVYPSCVLPPLLLGCKCSGWGSHQPIKVCSRKGHVTHCHLPWNGWRQLHTPIVNYEVSITWSSDTLHH